MLSHVIVTAHRISAVKQQKRNYQYLLSILGKLQNFLGCLMYALFLVFNGETGEVMQHRCGMKYLW